MQAEKEEASNARKAVAESTICFRVSLAPFIFQIYVSYAASPHTLPGLNIPEGEKFGTAVKTRSGFHWFTMQILPRYRAKSSLQNIQALHHHR